ncbi:MAG: histone deacetylase [Terriglobia bacterium]
MLPFKLVYSDGYDLNLGSHVFPAQKYKIIQQKCLTEGIAAPDDFLEPEPAPDADILRVHTQEWTRKLKQGKLSYFELLRLEVPYSHQLVRAFWLSAGGSTLAARRALAEGCAFNFGGGFHHAFPDHGEGFCAINDVAVAIRRLQVDRAIETALVVDLDVHQGNGTAAIFGGDASVYTLSLHQENNYPYPKPPSDLDVNLPDGIADGDYLRLLRQALDKAFTDFSKSADKRWLGRGAPHPQEKPDLIFYLAGADPYREDQLGGLGLTIAGLGERDRIVLEAARERSIPIAVTFAGGYARNTADTVQIHTNTILTARTCFKNLETTDAH